MTNKTYQGGESEREERGKGTNQGDRIVMLRGTLGITQRELAKISGISPAGISLLEKGHREPTLKTAILLSDAFGVSLDVFAGRKEYLTREYPARIELVKLHHRLKQIVKLAT